MLPYFIKAEANERREDQFHEIQGEFSVCEGRSMNFLMGAFVEAAKQAGYPENHDFNGATQDGVELYQCTQRNGMRCSIAVVYLHPAIKLTNLTVITGGLASRILFDGTRARGIEMSATVLPKRSMPTER